MKIKSIVYFKRFEKDSETIIYSSDDAISIDQKIFSQTPTIAISGFVTITDAIYNLDNNVTYGSNSFIVDQKPAFERKFYIPYKDITLVQEASIDLDDH